MIKVRCINAKGCKLLDGHIYEATSISNHASGSGSVYISGGGRYDVKRFETLDGTDIKTIQHRFTPSRKNEYINVDDNGKWVKCKWSGKSKNLIEGELYKIVEVQHEPRSWDPKNITNVKIEGCTRWISSNRFIKLDLAEQRTVKLKKVEKIDIQKKYDRKLDALSDMEKIKSISRLIFNCSTDIIKFNYDRNLIDIIIENNHLDLTKEDIKQYIENLKSML